VSAEGAAQGRFERLKKSVHNDGDVSQPQGSIEKDLSFIMGHLPFVIEASQFPVVK